MINKVFGVVGPGERRLRPTPPTQMNRPPGKKSKKPSKLSQNHLVLGIPANIVAGPLGFRAELDVGPEGDQIAIWEQMSQI